MSMTIIGVTGGIGAGKSSVSRILEELGARVIDADKLSHDVVEPGKLAWHQITEAFGKEILRADQSLDRKKLAQRVFHSEVLRLKLEAIVHTQVIRSIRENLDALRNQGYEGLVVLDVPIPVKHGFLDTVDIVWVITASEETRIARIIARSGMSPEEAKSRINAQLSQHEYLQLADRIIENDGSMEELKTAVKALVKELSEK